MVQTNPINIIRLGIVLIAVFFVSWVLGNLTVTALPVSLMLLAGITIGFIVLVNTNLALIILIFSMLLSPEFSVMQVPSRAVVVRVDDVLLVFTFFAWLAKTAINKELGLLRRTPLNLPIIAYLFACLFSTFLGIQQGRIDISKALFYILKYTEYAMLFFMVVNRLKDERQIKRFVFFFLFVYGIVCLTAYFQIGSLERTTAPFEGSVGEPNTLSGYLVFMMAIFAGLFLNAKLIRERWLYGGLFLFGLAPFFFTLSRSGYVAIVVMFIALGILNRRKKGIIILLLLFILMSTPLLLPNPVIKRIKTTFQGQAQYKFIGRSLQLEPSAAARIESWKVVFKRWPERPFLGFGVSYGFYDAQYITVLAETGIMGLFAFIWMLIVIFRTVFRVYSERQKNNFIQGLTLGYLAGFVALLTHAFTANTFIIVRIMEPFWFMTAMVVILPEVSPNTPPVKNEH